MKLLSTLFFILVSIPVANATSYTELQDWNNNTPQSLQSLKAPIHIINLWATWCGPCRKEMPEMSSWYKTQKKDSINMVGIAFDETKNIASFLKQTPVSYPIWRYTGNNSRAFMKTLDNNIGVLPFTLITAPKCSYNQSITGEINAKKLTAAVKTAKEKCQ